MPRKRGEEPKPKKTIEETPEETLLRTTNPYEYERQKLRKALLTDKKTKEEFEKFKLAFYPVVAQLFSDWPKITGRIGGDLGGCIWQFDHDRLPNDKLKSRWELFCLQYIEDVQNGKQLTIMSSADMDILRQAAEVLSKLKAKK